MTQGILGGSLRQVVLGLSAALLFIVAVEAVQLGTGGFGFFGWDGNDFGWHGTSIRNHNGNLSIVVREQGCKLELKSRGEIGVNDAEDEIVSVSTGGFLELEERGCGPSFQLEAEPGTAAGAAVQVKVDGKPAALDQAGKDRLHATLLKAYRATGWQADERAARLLRLGGVDGLLRETGEIQNDYGQQRYLAFLLAQPGLPEAVYGQAWRTAADGLSGDYEMSQLVKEAPPAALRAPELFVALETISGDYEMQQALETALEALPAGEQGSTHLAGLLGVATEISSDYELGQFLEKVAAKVGVDQTLPPQLDDALRTISSDYEQTQALTAFLEKSGIHRDLLGRLVGVAAEGISSDHELANFLETVSKRQERGEGWPPEVEQALETLGSRHERERARDALAR
jgi:hypothetical protein